MKLLLVEDGEIFKKMVEIWLLDSPYEIDYANTGEEAIYLLDKNHYDLVLLDFFLPFISGIQVFDYIAKHKMGTEIIMMSNHMKYIKHLERIKYKYDKPYTEERFLEILKEVELFEKIRSEL